MRTLAFTLPNGRTMSYMEYGNGNPNAKAVLVMHGLVGSVADEMLADKLKGIPLRMIYPARPGYGESDYFQMTVVSDWAKQLNTFLDALHLDFFDVAGISAGAPYAYSFAALYPNRVKTVYINSGVSAVYEPEILSCYPQQDIAFYQKLQKATREKAGQWLYNAYIPFFTEEIKRSRNFLDAMGGDLLNIGQESILQTLPWGFDVKDIRRPVILLHGTDDQVVPYAAAKATAARIPNAELITLEAEGHTSPRTMQAFMRLLTR
ncbi:MAG TPA: alpha/beta hydrolase [Clostridia bacterium]|nr:alpha/beta hydrolase [Clostridia bacterium]